MEKLFVVEHQVYGLARKSPHPGRHHVLLENAFAEVLPRV